MFEGLSTARRNAAFVTLAALAVALVPAAPALASTVQEQRTLTGESLTVRNLIGEVTVVGHAGSDFEVEITVQGRDATRGLVKIETTDDTLDLVFPDESRFVYPRLGTGSRTRISLNDGSRDWLGTLLNLGRGRIEVRGSGSGFEVWADLKIRMPAGKTLKVRHGVGAIDISDIEGKGEFAVRAGAIDARELNGSMLLDTGSGHVAVEGARGDLTVDTGSGHVEGRRLDGDLISVDTGSGHVSLEDVTARRLNVDTGSGRISATRVSTDSANIDTGSGSVELALEHMGSGSFRIDTGSGGIRLRLPEGTGADVQAETGSGGIHLDLGDAVRMKHKSRNEAAFSVGGGGAKVDLDTGSGSIRISRYSVLRPARHASRGETG